MSISKLAWAASVRTLLRLSAGSFTCVLPVVPVLAQSVLPIEQIVSRVLQSMNGAFQGGTYDSATQSYRLKFLSNGAIVVVIADARTGNIIRVER